MPDAIDLAQRVTKRIAYVQIVDRGLDRLVLERAKRDAIDLEIEGSVSGF